MLQRERRTQKCLSHTGQRSGIKEAQKRQSSLQTLTAQRRQLLLASNPQINHTLFLLFMESQGTVCVLERGTLLAASAYGITDFWIESHFLLTPSRKDGKAEGKSAESYSRD